MTKEGQQNSRVPWHEDPEKLDDFDCRPPTGENKLGLDSPLEVTREIQRRRSKRSTKPRA